MISRSNMVRLISRFRNLCLQSSPEDIDVLSKDHRDDRLGIALQYNLSSMLLSGMTGGPIKDICSLAKTPRLLKLILRRTHRIWDRLHGEIDFDDVLVANTLRFGAPEAFEFLLENHMEIRGLQVESAFQNRDARVEALENKWIRTSESAMWDATSAKSLAQFIFPCWHAKHSSRQADSLQGVQVSEPTDYWSRYLSEDVDPDTIRDQELLHGMAAWRQDADGGHFRGATLTSILCNNAEFASKFEYFSPLTMTGEDIRQIATKTFEEALATQGVGANNDSVAGFIPLWRRAIRQPIKETEHLEWVKNEIFRALPRSLRFTNDIYYYWSSNSEADIHRKKDRTALRSQVVSRAKEIFEGKPDNFIRVIDPNFMYSTYHFSTHFSALKEGGEGFTAAEWRWFAGLMLDAGEIAPQVIVPQIVCLIIEEQHRIEDFTYSFNEKFSKEFFGNDMSRLMSILSKEISVDFFDLREKRRIQTAKEVASKWLKENHS